MSGLRLRCPSGRGTRRPRRRPAAARPRPAPSHAQAQGTPDALPVTGAAARRPQAPAPSARGPHRRGSTAGSAAPRRPGRGRTARPRSTPPGPGTAATSLGAGGGEWPLPRDLPPSREHPRRASGHGTPAMPPRGRRTLSPRSAPGTPDSLSQTQAPSPPPRQAPGRCWLQGPPRLQPPASSRDPSARPDTPAGGTYLAARAGRAPGAAAPSCCSPARSGPSWRGAGPGSAGRRPAPRRSGTRPPAGASWTLGDTTDPADPEKRPGPGCTFPGGAPVLPRLPHEVVRSSPGHTSCQPTSAPTPPTRDTQRAPGHCPAGSRMAQERAPRPPCPRLPKPGPTGARRPRPPWDPRLLVGGQPARLSTCHLRSEPLEQHEGT